MGFYWHNEGTFLVTFLVRGSTVLVHMSHADVLWNVALEGIYWGSILLI